MWVLPKRHHRMKRPPLKLNLFSDKSMLMPFDRRRHHRDDLAGNKFVPLRHGTRFGNGIRLSMCDDSVTAPDFTTTMLQLISKCRRRRKVCFDVRQLQ